MIRRLVRLGGAVAFAVVATSGVAACGAADAETSASPGRAQTIEVRIRHSRFQPAAFDVAEGSRVRFVIRNDDPIDHEFLLGDQATQDGHERGTEAHHGARDGEVSVPAGAAAETSFTFDDAGTVLLGCHLPGHWDYGMRGEVRVSASRR